MKKKILAGSIIAVVILIMMSFSSVVGVQSVKNNPDNVITDELDFEYCKEYLFETIVEIADNPEAKELINSNNHNLFSTNSDFRHNLMFPLRRNTNKLSVEHLDLLYNMGLKLIDRLGEEKVLELIESIEIANPEVYEKLNEMIYNNEEFTDRIANLHQMNIKLESDDGINPVIWERPIICFIGVVLLFVSFTIYAIYSAISYVFISIADIISESLGLLFLVVFGAIGSPLGIICFLSIVMLLIFECYWDPPPDYN